jgi:hypothetical protein
VTNASDNCPLVDNLDQTDSDADGVGDVCDNCIDTFNPAQDDADADGIGDLCDADFRTTDRPVVPVHLCVRMSTSIRTNGYVKFSGYVDSSMLAEEPAVTLLLSGAALEVKGAGLVSPIAVDFPAAGCRARGAKRIQCKGTAGETAVFVRSMSSPMYKVKIIVRKLPIAGPLAPVVVHAVLSLGGTDVRFAVGGCKFIGTALVHCDR